MSDTLAFNIGDIVSIRNITPDAKGEVSAYHDGPHLIIGEEIAGFIKAVPLDFPSRDDVYWSGWLHTARSVDLTKSQVKFARKITPSELFKYIDDLRHFSTYNVRVRAEGGKITYNDDVYKRAASAADQLDALREELAAAEKKDEIGFISGDASNNFVEVGTVMIGTEEQTDGVGGIHIFTDEVSIFFKPGCSAATIFDLINPLVESFAE